MFGVCYQAAGTISAFSMRFIDFFFLPVDVHSSYLCAFASILPVLLMNLPCLCGACFPVLLSWLTSTLNVRGASPLLCRFHMPFLTLPCDPAWSNTTLEKHFCHQGCVLCLCSRCFFQQCNHCLLLLLCCVWDLGSALSKLGVSRQAEFLGGQINSVLVG